MELNKTYNMYRKVNQVFGHRCGHTTDKQYIQYGLVKTKPSFVECNCVTLIKFPEF